MARLNTGERKSVKTVFPPTTIMDGTDRITIVQTGVLTARKYLAFAFVEHTGSLIGDVKETFRGMVDSTMDAYEVAAWLRKHGTRVHPFYGSEVK